MLSRKIRRDAARCGQRAFRQPGKLRCVGDVQFPAIGGIEHVLVELADDVDQLVVPGVGVVLELGRDFAFDHNLAIVAIIDIRFHGDQVDNPFVVAFEADRNLHRDRVQFQLIRDIFNHFIRIRTGTVEFVDECNTRNAVALHLAVDGD